VKYVQRVPGKDGVVRLYFRKAGAPSVRLKSPEGSAELAAEVAALVAAAGPDRGPDTLRQALRHYELKSADFADLADSTKYEYRLILKELEEDFGAVPIAAFKPAYLLDLRNTWAPRGHRAANVRLQVLKNALWPAIVGGSLGTGDPFALIPQVRRPRDLAEPHAIWPQAVVEAVTQAAIAEGRIGLARGVAIARYAGPRLGDVVKLTKAARKTGRFVFLSGKRRVPVDLAEDPALTKVLDATPGRGLILAYNMDGLAYTESGFYQELRKLVARLHKAGKIDSAAYNMHGLRHTFGVEAALAGCTDAEGAALMGHGSPHSFATYRRQAERIRLSEGATAKIAALRERTKNADVKNDLENGCKTDAPDAERSATPDAKKA
jgi:integrase